MKRAAAAGFGVPLVQIYSDIGNVVPDGPHGFGVVFEVTGRCQRWLQERTMCVRAGEHICVPSGKIHPDRSRICSIVSVRCVRGPSSVKTCRRLLHKARVHTPITSAQF